MDWASIQTDLISAVQEASGNLSLDVTWKDRTSEWHASPWEGGHKVELSLSSLGSVNEDHVTYQEEAGQLRPTVYGARLPVIQFRVEAADQNLAAFAASMADTIRTGLRLPSAHAILQGCGLAIATMSPVQSIPEVEQNRSMSVVVWDVTFNASTAVAGALIDYFQTVVYTAEVTDAEDNPVLTEEITITLP